ncbi:hypothetical protein CMI48_00165 [Candidatus Pacearchaeota archaeon]|nr:hypothetical protein [Candidatus Pacearchaeota archaeon]|tara:strand:+ start:4800 stop:5507 length:708 start_codon:yes stop_codon:yes gene_type:complete
MAKEVCVVTGASSGLGKELAEVLCARGYSVWITARRKQELLALKKRCLHFRGEMHVIAGDLTDASFREKLVKAVLDKEGKIDFLFNNAGMGRATKFEEQTGKDMGKNFVKGWAKWNLKTTFSPIVEDSDYERWGNHIYLYRIRKWLDRGVGVGMVQDVATVGLATVYGLNHAITSMELHPYVERAAEIGMVVALAKVATNLSCHIFTETKDWYKDSKDRARFVDSEECNGERDVA